MQSAVHYVCVCMCVVGCTIGECTGEHLRREEQWEMMLHVQRLEYLSNYNIPTRQTARKAHTAEDCGYFILFVHPKSPSSHCF